MSGLICCKPNRMGMQGAAGVMIRTLIIAAQKRLGYTFRETRAALNNIGMGRGEVPFL
ncbi:hypothetical protein M6D81_04155 [Paenibacillus sp. J5C_2022]|nr:hypothetical protein [Paenibacillus sp. J5C2022]